MGAGVTRGSAVGRAAKLREHVRVMRLEPVAEARAHQVRRRGSRGAPEDVMLSIEEVGRVVRVPLVVRLEAGKPDEGGAGHLPAIPDQLPVTPGPLLAR